MKTKPAIIAAIMLLCASVSLAMAACSPRVQVEITQDMFENQNHISKLATISAGGEIVVTLASNPTTGYSWTEQAVIRDDTVLKQTRHRYIAPDKSLPGAGGKEEWTFKALQTGVTLVSIEYSRPWEGGEKAARTFQLMVSVMK